MTKGEILTACASAARAANLHELAIKFDSLAEHSAPEEQLQELQKSYRLALQIHNGQPRTGGVRTMSCPQLRYACYLIDVALGMDEASRRHQAVLQQRLQNLEGYPKYVNNLLGNSEWNEISPEDLRAALIWAGVSV